MRPARAQRDPVSFIHGEGAIIVIPTRVMTFLREHAGLDRWRRDHIGSNPEVDAVLEACRIAAALQQSAAPGLSSVGGTQVAPRAELGEEWVTTARAGALLDITSRGVLRAIQANKLEAERIDGRWRVRRHSVDRYRQARRQVR